MEIWLACRAFKYCQGERVVAIAVVFVVIVVVDVVV